MKHIFLFLFILLAGNSNAITFRVLQFNIWQEGTMVGGGYDAIVQQVVDSKADLIAFSEVRNYKDSYRTKYPDPVKNPGITYPADCAGASVEKLTWAPDSDERERIDFIYYSPDKKLKLKDAVVWGPSGSICRSKRVQETERIEIGSGIWPTDHKALLVKFELK